jgi:phenylacetate-CoA ligase
MGLATKVYEKSPLWLQNAMTTAQGWKIRRVRYTPHTWRTLEFLEKSQWWSSEQFETYGHTQLLKLVRHAAANSPYYRERYAREGVDVDVLKSVADVRLLPIVAKQDFRQFNDRFVCDNMDRKRLWAAHTGGTTGTPLTAYHTYRSQQERWAFMERLYGWYNPQRFRKRASFTGKLMANPDDHSGPFHRFNRANNQQLYSSHHLTPRNLDRYIDEMAAFGPEQIDGIASPIYVLADHIIRTKREGEIKPRVVIPTSETIWPYIRERMEQAFGCPVANQYASQEGAPLAYECPHGGFHTCPESGVFEILRADDSPCAPGEFGRLVVTTFLSKATPLIRYDIGDTAAWREGRCECGRAMPMLQNIEGRMDDMFYTRERGLIPRVDSAFKDLPPSIVATQVAQVALDRFEVRIVPDEAMYRDEHAQSLVKHLHDYVGREVKIEVKLLPEIARTKGGKMRAMINECDDPEVKNLIAQGWNGANAHAWIEDEV